MAPPPVGETASVVFDMYVTRHNDDGTVNVKRSKKPGAPFKVPVERIQSGPPPLPPKSAFDLIASNAPDCKGAAPTPGVDVGIRTTRSKANMIGWGSFLTVTGAIGVGIFHGVGNKILDAIWPYLEAVLRNGS